MVSSTGVSGTACTGAQRAAPYSPNRRRQICSTIGWSKFSRTRFVNVRPTLVATRATCPTRRSTAWMSGCPTNGREEPAYPPPERLHRAFLRATLIPRSSLPPPRRRSAPLGRKLGAQFIQRTPPAKLSRCRRPSAYKRSTSRAALGRGSAVDGRRGVPCRHESASSRLCC